MIDMRPAFYRAKVISGLSSGLINEPKQLRQPNAVTCAHACLAMVCGLKVKQVIEVFGDHRGLNTDEQKAFLGLCNVQVTELRASEFPDKNGVYVMTVPSLNLTDQAHRVIMYATDGEWVMRDPNFGKKGKKLYTVKRYISHSPRAYAIWQLTSHHFFVPNFKKGEGDE